MLLNLIAASLGAWTYAGFADDPTPKSAAPAPTFPGPTARTHDCPCPDPCLCEDCSCEVAKAKPKPKITPTAYVEPDAPAAPVAPTIWTLTDATGQAWTHADRAYLESFVASRNAVRYVVQPQYYAAGFAVGSACATGRCPR